MPPRRPAQAQAWLAQIGQTNEATLKKFNEIWSHPNRTVLDRVSDTLALDPETGKLIKNLNDVTANPPKTIPAAISDRSKPTFYRSNLALVFAKAISSRRVYEEASRL